MPTDAVILKILARARVGPAVSGAAGEFVIRARSDDDLRSNVLGFIQGLIPNPGPIS